MGNDKRHNGKLRNKDSLPSDKPTRRPYASVSGDSHSIAYLKSLGATPVRDLDELKTLDKVAIGSNIGVMVLKTENADYLPNKVRWPIENMVYHLIYDCANHCFNDETQVTRESRGLYIEAKNSPRSPLQAYHLPKEALKKFAHTPIPYQ